jgi:flagellar biosynthesis GTPase FlhF
MERKSEENKSARYRNMCFTVNNYTEEIYQKIKNSPYFKYVIIGKEISKTGTKHLQGYGELTYQMRLGSIMKKIHPMHVEARRGTQAQAIRYCQKDQDFVEIGEQNKQGERTDLKEIVDAVKSGKTRAEILESCLLQNGFQMQYESKCRTYLSDKKREIPEVIWIYGSTGCGKTQMINKLEGKKPELKVYFQPPRDTATNTD